MEDNIPDDGYKVIGTVKSIKGHCPAGHNVGDTFELSVEDSAGLCGWLYHEIFPHVWMLQAGGRMLGPNKEKLEKSILVPCMDMDNQLVLELKRIK